MTNTRTAPNTCRRCHGTGFYGTLGRCYDCMDRSRRARNVDERPYYTVEPADKVAFRKQAMAERRAARAAAKEAAV